MSAYAVGLYNISDASWRPTYRKKVGKLTRYSGGIFEWPILHRKIPKAMDAQTMGEKERRKHSPERTSNNH